MSKNLKIQLWILHTKLSFQKLIFFYSCETSCENAYKYVMELVWRNNVTKRTSKCNVGMYTGLVES